MKFNLLILLDFWLKNVSHDPYEQYFLCTCITHAPGHHVADTGIAND